MARLYAAIKASIWQDDDFRDLSPAAQHLYFVLLTSPGLSFAGVGDWRPRRILPLAKGWRMNDLDAAAGELSAALLIVVDQETEEYLVRSFLRHDGVMQHNKTCISAMTAFAEIGSNRIRGVVVHELKRLREENPDWPCWERDQVKTVLKRRSIAPGSAPGVAPGVAPRSAPAVAPGSAATPAPEPAPGVAPGVHLHQHQHLNTKHPTARDSEPTVSDLLTEHGLSEDDQPGFIAWLKTQGTVRSVPAVVRKIHRDGALPGRIKDWQLEVNASRVVPLGRARKTPNVGVEEWMLRQ